MRRARRATIIGTGLAALLASAAPGTAAADEPLTLRDSLYVLPLGQPSAIPECVLVLCPLVQPFPAVGSGADAGSTGLRAFGLPLAPTGVTAEARSEPLPYDGAGEDGTASVAFSVVRSAEGSGGTVTTSVVLQDQAGATVAQLPPSTVPLDGTRRTVGPVAVDPKALTPGRSYVAVARIALSAPAGASVQTRVQAPRLLALGPRRAPRKPRAFKPAAPVTRLSGRTLRVTARCPSGPSRCDVEVRTALNGRTLKKGAADMQAAARHTFTYRLSAAELRRVRRVGRITTTLRLEDEAGRTGSARSSLRVPRG